jgi:hypothetical protein
LHLIVLLILSDNYLNQSQNNAVFYQIDNNELCGI